MPVAPIIVNILGESTELEASLASAGASIKAFGASATLSFAGVGAAITSAGASIKAFGAEMTAVGMSMSTLVTVPIVAVGAAALLSANNVQKAYAIIIAGTGATGDKLQGLETQFDSLAATIPNSFTDTATVLTTVNDKLQQGGYNITQISHDILDVSRMTGESADSLASDFTAAIQQWKISAADTSNFMNTVYSTAQAARVPVTQILTDLDTYGPTIRAANIPLNDAIPIIGDIESKGEDATRTFQGMAYAWANVAKMIADPSKTTQKAVDDITLSAKNAGISLTSTGNDVQAVFAGIKAGTISDADAASIFGSRFGANITQMIRDGTISAQDFITMTNGMALNIGALGQQSITFAQSIDIMKNALEVALKPLGLDMIAAMSRLMPLITGVIGVIGMLTGAFAALPTPVADAIFVIVGLAAAIGPALILVGGLVSAFGTIVTAAGAVVAAIPVAVGVIALLAPVLVVAALAFGALTAIIAPLVAALYLAYTSSAAFRGALSDLGGALGTVGSAFATLGDKISTGLSYIISGNYKAGFAEFTTGFTDMWNTVSAIDWGGLGTNLVNEIATGLSTNMPKVVTALSSLITDAKNTWNTVSKDFTTWAGGVNWAADAKKIPVAIISGLTDLQSLLTPVWNVIETSFTAWRDSVPWATLASQIPIDISNAIQLSMATIGPVWDYIQISLMNWIQSVNWDSVGTQLGAGLRYAIKLALDSLVGGLSDLIPTALVTSGQPNLIGVGITAAKSFVGGFQSGLGDLWKLIIDGLEPLAGKIADYMEHDVDWTGIGTFIGTTLGSIIAGLMGQPLAEMGGGSGGGGAPTITSSILSQVNNPSKTGVMPDWSTGQGYSKLQQAADDAGNAMATGFVKGAQDAMANIDWGTIIKNAIMSSVGLGSNSSPNTSNPNSGPLAFPSLQQMEKGGILGDSSLEPWNNLPGGFNIGASLGSGLQTGGTDILKGLSAFDPETWGLGGIGGGIMGGLGGFGGNVMGGLGGIGGALGGIGGDLGFSPMIDASNYNATQGHGFGSATIDLPQKIMGFGAAVGNIDWGKLTKGGILDPKEWSDFGGSITGFDWGKAIKGGILDPKTWTDLGGSVASGAGQVASAASNVGGMVVGGAKSIWDFITGGAKSIWDFITGTARDIWTYITGTARDIWTYITGAAHDIWTYITGGAHDIWTYITGGAHDIWTYITGGAHDVWSYITGGAHDIWTYITGGAHDIWTYITGGAHDVWSYITGGARDIWSYITGGARDIWSYITGGARDIWSYITGGARDIWSYITGGARDIWSYITGGARDIWSYITGGAHDIWSYITGGAHDIWATYITGGAKDISNFITGTLNVGSLISGTVDISKFLTGTYAVKGTGQQPATASNPQAANPQPRATGAYPIEPIAALTGAIFDAKQGGTMAMLAEAGEAEMVVPQERWGESWTHLIQTMPHFGAGGIVGNVSMPAIPQIPALDSLSGLKNYIESAVKNAAGPKYEINVTPDGEAWKREVLQAILELEQFHHLGGGSY